MTFDQVKKGRSYTGKDETTKTVLFIGHELIIFSYIGRSSAPGSHYEVATHINEFLVNNTPIDDIDLTEEDELKKLREENKITRMALISHGDIIQMNHDLKQKIIAMEKISFDDSRDMQIKMLKVSNADLSHKIALLEADRMVLIKEQITLEQ
jgi:hypothetical protein